MESLELNKIAAAILTAGIAYSALGLLSDQLSHPQRLAKSVLNIKGTEAPAAGGAAAPSGPGPIAPLLAKADPSAGEAFTKKICIACHNFQEGAGNKVGPVLYGVVGREKASAPGFNYSNALKKKGGKWTFADLNDWLYKPAGYVPGTKMAYTGIENDATRANVIAYLRTLSKNPEPLPKVTEADTKAAAAAKAGGGAAPPAENLDALLAKAVPSRGQAFTKKICIACHNFDEGGANKMGPALYGVVGRDKASAPGFTYSAALKKKSGKWSFADLNEWLTKPSAYAPGTKMAFAGIEDPQLRADVIDYLHTLSKSPEKLPAASASDQPKPATGQPAAAGSTPPGTSPAGDNPGGEKPPAQQQPGKAAAPNSGASSQGQGKPQ